MDFLAKGCAVDDTLCVGPRSRFRRSTTLIWHHENRNDPVFYLDLRIDMLRYVCCGDAEKMFNRQTHTVLSRKGDVLAVTGCNGYA